MAATDNFIEFCCFFANEANWVIIAKEETEIDKRP